MNTLRSLNNLSTFCSDVLKDGDALSSRQLCVAFVALFCSELHVNFRILTGYYLIDEFCCVNLLLVACDFQNQLITGQDSENYMHDAISNKTTQQIPREVV